MSHAGDDGKAPIDASIRARLVKKPNLMMMKISTFDKLEESQHVEIERLRGILRWIEGMPMDYYLSSTGELVKTVKYCGSLAGSGSGRMGTS